VYSINIHKPHTHARTHTHTHKYIYIYKYINLKTCYRTQLLQVYDHHYLSRQNRDNLDPINVGIYCRNDTLAVGHRSRGALGSYLSLSIPFSLDVRFAVDNFSHALTPSHHEMKCG